MEGEYDTIIKIPESIFTEFVISVTPIGKPRRNCLSVSEMKNNCFSVFSTEYGDFFWTVYCT